MPSPRRRFELLELSITDVDMDAVDGVLMGLVCMRTSSGNTKQDQKQGQEIMRALAKAVLVGVEYSRFSILDSRTSFPG